LIKNKKNKKIKDYLTSYGNSLEINIKNNISKIHFKAPTFLQNLPLFLSFSFSNPTVSSHQYLI